MRPDPSPNDVGLAFAKRGSVLERGPPIVGPGHLEDGCGTLDALDPQAQAKAFRLKVATTSAGGSV
jgi:hypothetical protein